MDRLFLELFEAAEALKDIAEAAIEGHQFEAAILARWKRLDVLRLGCELQKREEGESPNEPKH
jgi:hypothetical protein